MEYLKRFCSAGFLALTLSGCPRSALAYENQATHPLMTVKGKNLLQNSSPVRYFELDEKSTRMSGGSTNEDVPLPNVLSHFFNPATGHALRLSDGGILLPPLGETAIERGRTKWDLAVSQYRAGFPDDAYESLGRALHLLTQDMAQPGHIHNDPHLVLGSLNADRSHLEELAEQIALSQTASFPEGTSLVTAAPGAASPFTQVTPEDFGVDLARLVFTLSRFTGELNDSTGLGFIDIGTNRRAAGFILGDPFGIGCTNRSRWQIAGLSRPLCWDPTQIYDGPLFDNDWWREPERLGVFDPLLAAQVFYIDRHEEVNIGAGGGQTSLTQHYVSLLVPHAINYTAGLIKLFAQTVDADAPRVRLRENNLTGQIIPPGGATGAQDIVVEAFDYDPILDPVNIKGVSGIYRIILTQTSGGNFSSTATFAGPVFANHTFPRLAEGQYAVLVIDGLANEAVRVTFKIDATKPVVQIRDHAGRLLLAGTTTNATFVTVSAQDPLVNGVASGIDRVIGESLDPLVSGATVPAGGLSSVSKRLPPGPEDTIPPGSYRILVPDRAGNVNVTQPIIVDQTPPRAVVQGLVRFGSGASPMAIFDGFGNISYPGCDGNQNGLGVVIGDRVGIALRDDLELKSFHLRNSAGAAVIDPGPLDGSRQQDMFSSLGENHYDLTVCDQAGNCPNDTLFVDYGPDDQFPVPTFVQAGEEWRTSLTGRARSSWGLCYVKLLPADAFQFPSSSEVIDRALSGVDTQFSPTNISSFTPNTRFDFQMNFIPNGEYVLFERDLLGVISQAPMFIGIAAPLSFYAATPPRPFFGASGTLIIKLSNEEPIPLEVEYTGVQTPGETTAIPTTKIVPPVTPVQLITVHRGSNLGFRLFTTGTSTGPTRVSIGYSTAALTQAQALAIRMYQFGPGGPVDVTVSVDTQTQLVAGSLATLDPFALLVPAPPSSSTVVSGLLVGGRPALELASYASSVTLREIARSNPEVAAGLATLRPAAGLGSVGSVFALGPGGTSFLPAAKLVARYSTPELAAAGIAESSLGLYRSLDGFQTVEELPHSAVDSSRGEVGAEVLSLPNRATTYVAVMGKLSDFTPPRTTLAFLGPRHRDAAGLDFVSTRTAVSLNAEDQAPFGAVASGVGVRSYRIDAATAFKTFVSSFTLDEGTHSVTYFSADRAGNVEAVQVSSVAVDGTPPTASLAVTGPVVVTSSGVIVGPQTFFSLSAVDPVSNGVSAGTAAIAALIDETAASCGLSLEQLPVIVPGAPVGSCGNPLYSEPFAVPTGTHTLTHFAIDNVLNVGVQTSTVVVGDYAAPSAVFQDVPLYTRNPLPPLRAVFSDALAGVNESSLSLTLDGTPLPSSVVGTGDLGAWQSAPSLSLPLHAFEVVHLNGWLYSLGGHAGAFQTPRVLLSRLIDGAPQAWADTAPLPRILAAHSAAVLGGRIYTVGGTVAGDGALNSVFYADPDDATGLISSWQTGPSLPSSLGFLDAVGLGVANRRLYAVGGRDGGGSPRNTVNFSPIDAQTGAPGAWNAATNLPVPLAFSDAVEWNGRIYVAGGLVGPAATDATDRILSIGSDSNGQLVGSWRDERVMPNPVYSLEVAVLQGRLYVMGGFDRQNVKQSAVHSAAIAADGTLGPWRAEAPLHRPMGFFGSAATSGALYYAGGDTSTGISADVRWSRLGVGDLSNVLVTAGPAAPLTERPYTLAALGADRVGNAGSTSRTLTVDFTAPAVTLIAGGRTLSPGSAQFVAGAAPRLTAAFSDVTSGIDPASIAVYLDRADVTSLAQIVVNGKDAQAAYTPTTLAPGLHSLEARAADRAGNATTMTAQFLLDPAPPDVALSSPTSGALFGAGPIALHADFADSLSGLATGTLTLTVDGATLAATISFDAGGPPGWQTAPSLSLALHAFEVVHLNGWLYSLGGHAGAFQTSRVLLSQLIGGVPQGWNDTTALPSILAAHSAAVLGGRIYTLGGSIVGAPALNTVYYADPDDTSGLIAAWNTGASLPSSLGFLDAVGLGVANRHLYAVGGRDGGGSPHNTVFFSPVDLQTGAPGAWNQTTALPVPLAFSDAVEWNGRIYVAGGLVGPAATDATDRILSIASDSNGLLVGAWRDERVMPLPVYGLEVAVLQGRLYVMGGFDRQNVKQSAVHSAAIASDGTLGAWRAEAPLHRPMSFFGSAATSGALYYAGGDTSTGLSADVRYMKAGGPVLLAHASATAAGLAEGGREARAAGADLAGNVAFASAAFFVDLTPPETALELLGAVRRVGATTYALAGTPLRLSATDYPAGPGGAGVAASYLSASGGAASGGAPFMLAGSTVLPAGRYALAFASVDRVGNFESTRTAGLKLDGDPPAAVTDLRLAGLSSHTVLLSWTAPGDDGFSGDIADAEVRLAFGPDPAALAVTAVLSSGPVAAGRAFALTRAGLAAGTTYYARVLTRDTAGNWSAPSPLAAARTFSVTVSSDGLATLVSPVPAQVTVVSTLTAAQAYAVAVASQALAPAGDFYELTSGLVFSTAAPALLSFIFDPARFDPAAVAIYTYDPLALRWSSAAVLNQTLALLADGRYRVSGELLHTSLYAPMVQDIVPPETAFSVAGSSAVLEGRLFAVGGSSGVLTAQDQAPRGGVRSGVTGTFYRIGAGPEAAYAAPFTLPEGDSTVVFRSIDANGNREEAKSARLFLDASAPALALEVDQSTFPLPGGFGTLSATVTLTLSAADPDVNGARSGLAGVSVSVNGAPLAVALRPGDAAASTSVVLAAGLNTVVWSAADRMGNSSLREVKVAVGDTEPPVTTLAVGSPKAVLADGAILVSAASALSLSAEDFAQSGVPSGIAAIYRRFTPGAFAVYAGPFGAPAPDGAKTLEFYAVDRAGNAETPPKRQALVLDASAPALALSFPRPEEAGLCSLAQERLAVRGSVRDAHLARWDLKEGGVLLGSGAAAADGLLGFWDAAGKSGSFELSLRASDLVANGAAVALAVQAGAPARTLALGGKRVLSKPRGVAAGPNRIYVADTNADRVRVFDAAGAPLAVLGDKKGAARLDKPAGLALDAAGNVLVADAGNKRVVKLSPAGAFLAEYGKGVLKRPMAVVLSAGRIVVADAKAAQLVLFSEAGVLLARVDLPAVPARRDEDDEEDDGDDDEEDAPRPMALAADFAGNIWVTDAEGGRVLRYTPAFVLAQTIPGFKRPEGVAVSPSGACLAVSDAKDARIRTFDAALSAGLAAFGRRGEIKENRALPAEFFLNKPAQLAFDAQGTLLVADRNNDLIQGFGLPGTPVVVALGTPGRSGGGTRLAAADGDSGEVVASARVGRLEGGRVEHPDGTVVEIPAGAINADLDVAVAKAPDSGDAHRAREAARGLAGLAAGSAAREFSPHGLAFTEPAVITLPYDPLLVSAPRELRIHYWNGERGVWEALASTLDQDARTVSARVAHFSVYQVLAPAGAALTLADPDAGFAFRAIYAFPNPAVGGQRPTVHVAVGKADKVTFRFYDVAGTPVHEATLDTPSIVNDESGPHWAYEYAWSGHIPSGVYLYTVTAEKAGHAPIKRVGKLAVVR